MKHQAAVKRQAAVKCQAAVRRRTAAVLLAGAIATVTVAGPASAAPKAPSGPSASGYTPHTISFKPSIITFKPRIIDLSPPPAPGGAVTITSDVLFAFDQSTLSPAAQSVLGQIVTQLKKAPAGQVVVTGYTDSVGDASYNVTLSQQRAAAVVAFLQPAVARSDLTYQATGDGEADPVAPNANSDGSDNPAGRAENRRVTIAPPS